VKEGVVSFLEKRPAKFPQNVSMNMPPYFPWWTPRTYPDIGIASDAVLEVERRTGEWDAENCVDGRYRPVPRRVRFAPTDGTSQLGVGGLVFIKSANSAWARGSVYLARQGQDPFRVHQ